MSEVLAYPSGRLLEPSRENEMEMGVKYPHLTLERVKELLDYDPEEGILRWRVRPSKKSRKRAGDAAGTIQSAGFRVVTLDGKLCQGAQIAFLLAHGRWAKSLVRLKNGVKDDLRADNLYETRTSSKKHDLRTPEGKRAYSRDYWKTNEDYRRALGHRRYFGMTPAQYHDMLDKQGGVCAICNGQEVLKTKSGGPRWLAVDHSHDTLAVRGLLCNSCNNLLARAKDDTAILAAAIRYLEAAKARETDSGTIRITPRSLAWPTSREAA